MRLGSPDSILANNLYDLICYVYYLNFQPDIIVLGDDITILSERFRDFAEEDIKKSLSKIKGRYNQVELGRLCQTICKRKSMKIPKIIVISTLAFLINDEAISDFINKIYENGFSFVKIGSKFFITELKTILS